MGRNCMIISRVKKSMSRLKVAVEKVALLTGMMTTRLIITSKELNVMPKRTCCLMLPCPLTILTSILTLLKHSLPKKNTILNHPVHLTTLMVKRLVLTRKKDGQKGNRKKKKKPKELRKGQKKEKEEGKGKKENRKRQNFLVNPREINLRI